MGNTFGNMPNNGINLYLHPEISPDPLKEPTNDPNEGFESARKRREIKASIEELKSAKVALAHRDYCSDELLKFRVCRKDNWPFAVNCEHEKHAYLHCQYDDYVMRMKEYERERRIMVRSQKMAAAS